MITSKRCDICGAPCLGSLCSRHKAMRPCESCSRLCNGRHCASCAMATRRAKAGLEPVDNEDEWTQERVDALVAQQYRNLPKWWGRACRREQQSIEPAPAARQPVKLLTTRGRRLVTTRGWLG